MVSSNGPQATPRPPATSGGQAAFKDRQRLKRPQMRYVPATSLPQVMQSLHLERYTTQMEVGKALSSRGPATRKLFEGESGLDVVGIDDEEDGLLVGHHRSEDPASSGSSPLARNRHSCSPVLGGLGNAKEKNGRSIPPRLGTLTRSESPSNSKSAASTSISIPAIDVRTPNSPQKPRVSRWSSIAMDAAGGSPARRLLAAASKRGLAKGPPSPDSRSNSKSPRHRSEQQQQQLNRDRDLLSPQAPAHAGMSLRSPSPSPSVLSMVSPQGSKQPPGEEPPILLGAPDDGKSTAAVAAAALEGSPLTFRALTARRKLHPRLRWPRMQQMFAQVDASAGQTAPRSTSQTDVSPAPASARLPGRTPASADGASGMEGMQAPLSTTLMPPLPGASSFAPSPPTAASPLASSLSPPIDLLNAGSSGSQMESGFFGNSPKDVSQFETLDGQGFLDMSSPSPGEASKQSEITAWLQEIFSGPPPPQETEFGPIPVTVFQPKKNRRNIRPVSKCSKDIVTRVTVLPRPHRQPKIVAGTVSTMHTQLSAEPAARKSEQGGQNRRARLAQQDSSDSSSSSSSESDDDTIAKAGAGKLPKPVKWQNMGLVDRKWLLRVAPISCLPNRITDPKSSNLDEPPPQSARMGRQVSMAQTMTTDRRVDSKKAGEYLNFENWGLSDDYLDSLLIAHQKSTDHGLDSVRHISLSHNQLTGEGVAKVLSHCLPSRIKTLNLTANHLEGQGAGNVLAITKTITSCRHIQELDLSDNKLGDSFIEILCSLISGTCLELKGLSLSKCDIGKTPRGGMVLGSLMGVGRLLTCLDLSWNHLHGEGAIALARGLYENGAVAGGKLRRVNVAWNRMGSGSFGADESRRKEATAVAKALAEVFRYNQILFHLDLAYNTFNADDCALFADALHDNHTLFGLHLVGNEAVVDSLGFVIPLHRGQTAIPMTARPEGEAEEEHKGGQQGEGTNSDKAEDHIAQAELRLAHQSEEWFGDACQLQLNRLLSAVPSKYHMNHPVEFTPDTQGQAKMTAPEDRSRMLKQNPSLQMLAQLYKWQDDAKATAAAAEAAAAVAAGAGAVSLGGPSPSSQLNSDRGSHGASKSRGGEKVVPFSEEDIHWERQYVAQNSRVQTIAGDFETVDVNAKCCWICENWVEHRLTFDPLTSLNSMQQEKLGEIRTVYAFYGIDGFARPTILQQQEAQVSRARVALKGADVGSHVAVRKRFQSRSNMMARRSTSATKASKMIWVAYRMLPRSLHPMEVVFVVNGHVCIRQDLPHVWLHKSRVIGISADMEGLESFKEFSQVNTIAAGCGGLTSKGVDEGAQAWVVPNTLCVVEDPSQSGVLNCLPRTLGVPQREEKDPWTFAASIFRDYSQDDEVVSSNCLEADWHNGRLGQIIRTEAARNEIVDCLGSIYKQVMLAYWWEAYGNLEYPEQVAGVSMYDFRGLLARYGGEGRGALLDGQSCKGSDCDCIFVASNVVDRNRRADFNILPQRALSRFQFLEAVVRISIRRFLNTGGPTRDLPPSLYRHAISSMLQISNLGADLVKLRDDLHEELFTENCDKMFAEYEEILRPIFNHFKSDKNNNVVKIKKHKKKTLSYSGWIQLLKAGQVIDEDFTVQSAGHAFALARELRTDEISNTRHMELSWSEFLVAIAAVVKLMALAEGEETASIALADLLDDFLTTHMQEAFDSLGKSGKTAEGEYVQLQGLLARLYAELNTKSSTGHGKVSLRMFHQCFERPSTKLELSKCRLSQAEVAVVCSTLALQVRERQGENVALFGNDDVSFEEIIACVMQIKQALKGYDRAIAYIERTFDDFDLDKSGTLDSAEFQRLLEEPTLQRKLTSIGFDKQDFQNIFEVLKDDESIAISMEQVAEGCMCLRDCSFAARRGLRLLQRHFVKSNRGAAKGSLSKEQVLSDFYVPEITERLVSMHLTPPDWSMMFDELDVDGSGDLSWEEISDGMLAFWQNTWRPRS